MITSTSNAQIKNIQQLIKKSSARREQGGFIVEGERIVSEIPRDLLKKCYVSESFAKEHGMEDLMTADGSLGAPATGLWQELCLASLVEVVSDRIMEGISDTKTPQGVLALVRMKERDVAELLADSSAEISTEASTYAYTEISTEASTYAYTEISTGTSTEASAEGSIDALSKDALSKDALSKDALSKDALSKDVSSKVASKKDTPLYVVLDHLQDPGNLGTILRTAEGAKVTALIMSEDTVDIYNPKVVRATMGSLFRVPFVYVKDLPKTLQLMKSKGIRLCAAHLQGEHNYFEEDYTGATAFLIGNEGNGLSDAVTNEANLRVRIPMGGQLESLNAAVSAALFMYEAVRQRRA